MQPVIGTAEEHLRQLRVSINRLMDINDKMFGAQPSAPEKTPTADAPYYCHMAAIESLAQETARALAHLSNEISRLEDGLYLSDGKLSAVGQAATATISRSGY